MPKDVQLVIEEHGITNVQPVVPRVYAAVWQRQAGLLINANAGIDWLYTGSLLQVHGLLTQAQCTVPVLAHCFANTDMWWCEATMPVVERVSHIDVAPDVAWATDTAAHWYNQLLPLMQTVVTHITQRALSTVAQSELYAIVRGLAGACLQPHLLTPTLEHNSYYCLVAGNKKAILPLCQPRLSVVERQNPDNNTLAAQWFQIFYAVHDLALHIQQHNNHNTPLWAQLQQKMQAIAVLQHWFTRWLPLDVRTSA